MTIWAILPVKPIRNGKSRLSGVLSENQREALNLRMFENTLTILCEIEKIEKILVVSRDSGVLAYARNHGAHTIQEDSDSELNLALKRATIVTKNYSVNSLLILPADLPLLQAEDLEKIIDVDASKKMMVIVPDRRMEGTNVLFLQQVEEFDYLFGQNSFQFHVQQGIEKGFETVTIINERLGLDLDFPEDIEYLKQVSPLSHEHFLHIQETYQM
jgi:2-phospho-L-lactate guanylyltransferase